MATKSNSDKSVSVEISMTKITQAAMTVYVAGLSPFIFHRLGMRSKQELLLPRKKPNKAEKESTSKHDVLAEYRDSVYRSRDPRSDTLLVIKSATFKAAIRNAALDTPGAAKAQIGRLTYIEDEEVSFYGTPEIYITDVMNSGINRTPDIRTRAIVPKWAAKFVIRFAVPLLSQESVSTLIATAGQIIGVGDFRVQKGAGSFGRFEMVTREQFDSFVKVLGKRKEQEAALKSPEAYDEESRELMEWFKAEANRRGFKVA